MSQVRVSSLPHSLSRPLSETPLARERLLPVHQALAPLFGLASGDLAPLALTRGHTVACVLPGHEHEVNEFDCDRELACVAGQWIVQALGQATA